MAGKTILHVRGIRMKERIFFAWLITGLLTFSFSACTEKQGEVKPEKGEEKTVKAEETLPAPQIGPHTGGDVKKWVSDIGAAADPELLKKIEPFTKKFTAGELIAGIAARPINPQWNKLTEEQQLKTLAIMNTNFSKTRVDAGIIEVFKSEGEKTFNSTLYLEDDKGNIVAVSDPQKGSYIFRKTAAREG